MTTEPTHKVCSICGNDLPIDNFPIYGKNKTGHHTYCKPCTSTYQKLHELWKKQGKGGAFVCTSCHQILPKTEICEADKDRRQRRRCKDCAEKEQVRKVDNAIEQYREQQPPTPEQPKKEPSTLPLERTEILYRVRENPLEEVNDQDIFQELRKRGYKGTLTHTVDL